MHRRKCVKGGSFVVMVMIIPHLAMLPVMVQAVSFHIPKNVDTVLHSLLTPSPL